MPTPEPADDDDDGLGLLGSVGEVIAVASDPAVDPELRAMAEGGLARFLGRAKDDS